MDKEKLRRNIIIILLIILIVILYLLILKFGNIEHRNAKVPTGNIDIFEIDCNCDICKKDIDENKQNNPEEQEEETLSVLAYDDYKIYDQKDLRIFENPSYEFNEIIAPGSENSYTFVIKNNNDFDIYVDLNMEEENKYNINMNYKLKTEGKYVVGSNEKYENTSMLKDSNVLIKAKSYKTYILDWKWIDNDKDTSVGIADQANYKLKIIITGKTV